MADRFDTAVADEERELTVLATALHVYDDTLDTLLDMYTTPPTPPEPESHNKTLNDDDTLFGADPYLPLNNMRHEGFLQAVVEGEQPVIAWLKHVSPNGSRKSARDQASRLLRKPHVERRRRILTQQRVDAEKKKLADAPDLNAPMGKTAIIKELRQMLAETQGQDKRRGILMDIAKLEGHLGKQDDKKAPAPDPVFLMDYLRKAKSQGRDPVEMAREDHGEGDSAPEPVEGRTEAVKDERPTDADTGDSGAVEDSI